MLINKVQYIHLQLKYALENLYLFLVQVVCPKALVYEMHHFDNSVVDIDDPISNTSNDLNSKLTIFFDTNFLNPLTNAFYDVVALIDGKRYHLRNSGSNFQLNIRNKEMNLLEREAGEGKYPIIIEANDGLGNSFKETPSNNKFNINYSA